MFRESHSFFPFPLVRIPLYLSVLITIDRQLRGEFGFPLLWIRHSFDALLWSQFL